MDDHRHTSPTPIRVNDQVRALDREVEDHHDAATQLLDQAAAYWADGLRDHHDSIVARATVHAMLAQADATLLATTVRG